LSHVVCTMKCSKWLCRITLRTL